MANLYPLWRVIYEEKIHGIDKIPEYNIEIQFDEDMPWVKLYTEDTLTETQIALNRLQLKFEPMIRNFLLGFIPRMFTCNGMVYKVEDVLPYQSCVIGTYIPGNVVYDDIDEPIIKIDYVKDIVSFYNKNEALIQGGQLFMNGNLILNHKELKDKCIEIGQEYEHLDLYPDKIIKYIKSINNDLRTYHCKTFSRFNINLEED